MKIPLKICAIFLVVALLATPTVSAEKIKEYTVLPSIGNATSEVTIAVTGSVVQGQTDRQQFYVGNGVRWLEVNLNWTDSSDSLALTIYTPKWVKIGTYHDIDDGAIDGKIHIGIIPDSGFVESGVWTFDVYGERVATQRRYELNVYPR